MDLGQARFEECQLDAARFERCDLRAADFTTSFGVSLDPAKNKVPGARISSAAAVLMAEALGMKVSG